MKKIVLIISALLVFTAPAAFGWGKAGHDAVAYIAECNLTKKARRNVERYLGGRSIVYYSTWMDEYRKTPEHNYMDGWHVGYVDEELRNTPEVWREKGDCVKEIAAAIDLLRNYRELEDSVVNLNLKFIIHLAGDMHCPVHIKYPETPNFRVKLNGQDMTYHAVWDSGLIEASHRWHYTEYRHQLDRWSKAERKAVSQGTPADWFHESAADCRVIYQWASPGEELGQDFVNRAHELAEIQILKAGYCLAAILNELFG